MPKQLLQRTAAVALRATADQGASQQAAVRRCEQMSKSCRAHLQDLAALAEALACRLATRAGAYLPMKTHRLLRDNGAHCMTAIKFKRCCISQG